MHCDNPSGNNNYVAMLMMLALSRSIFCFGPLFVSEGSSLKELQYRCVTNRSNFNFPDTPTSVHFYDFKGCVNVRDLLNHYV